MLIVTFFVTAKIETTQMCIKTVVCPNNEILLSNKKQSTDICYSIKESENNYAELRNPDKIEQMLCGSIHK